MSREADRLERFPIERNRSIDPNSLPRENLEGYPILVDRIAL
jgi:hypothetical protein